MKKILLLFILMSSFAFSQMPNISKVWTNNGKYYVGEIGNGSDKATIKLKINISEQDKKNDQEYFVSGSSVVEQSAANFEGKLKITKYKDGGKRGTVFGEYDLSEEMKGKHSGTFKGKFIYTFKWNKKTQQIENPYIEFVGDWKSYDGKMTYKTNWTNQEKK